MTDREKVIKGLEICSDCGFCESIKKFDLRCPYRNNDGKGCDRSQLLMDALALLKEQQQQIWEFQDQVEYLTDKQKEQERIIKQYQKVDGFLFAHGWKWKGR